MACGFPPRQWSDSAKSGAAMPPAVRACPAADSRPRGSPRIARFARKVRLECAAQRKLFVTTALPYANGTFHIGHVMEYIQADIWVRLQRMQGHEVHFVCADDAHGAPIMIAAEKAGKTPQEFVAAHRRRAQAVPRRLPHRASTTGTRTDAPENHELAQDIYLALRDGRPDRHAHRSSSSSTRSRACSCPTATSRANARTAAPRTSTATTARSAVRSTRRPT